MNAADTILTAIESALNSKLVQKAIYITATVLAVIVGVVAYLSTVLLLFWEDHGDTIKLRAAQFTSKIADFTVVVFNEGVNSRPFIVTQWGRFVDFIYFDRVKV